MCSDVQSCMHACVYVHTHPTVCISYFFGFLLPSAPTAPDSLWIYGCFHILYVYLDLSPHITFLVFIPLDPLAFHFVFYFFTAFQVAQDSSQKPLNRNTEADFGSANIVQWQFLVLSSSYRD